MSASLFVRIKRHASRWYGQALIILLVFFAVRAYTLRDIVAGSAPDITGVLLTGAPVQLQDFRGAPVMVHFWATWCPVCKLEEQGIQSLSRDYPLLTIAMNSGENLEVQGFMAERGLNFPVLNDPDGVFAQQYGVRGVPSSFFVDAVGNIRFVEVGYTSEWGMRLRLWWLD